MTSSSFSSFATLAQAVLETSGTEAKIQLVARYFSGLQSDKEVQLAAQFLGEGAFSTISRKRMSISPLTIAKQASLFCEIDYEMVFKPSRVAVGSTSETIQKLFENLPEAYVKCADQHLSLPEMEAIFEELGSTRARDRKNEILHETWAKITPLETKYFLRILSRGNLGIGFETKCIITAIAIAFGKKMEAVHFAHVLTGSLGETAVLAKNENLDLAAFRLFHPISFMQASPLEPQTLGNLDQYIAEEKLDGLRCQVHISGQRVEIYARELKEITHSFPEIVAFFQERNVPETVLDGKLCVVKNNTILTSALLQKRLGVKKPSKKLIADVPVLFISHDLLFWDDEPLFRKSYMERRQQLEELSRSFQLPFSVGTVLNNQAEVLALITQAEAHGNTGVILKRKDSVYESGLRSKNWWTINKPNRSLITTLLYAHAENGNRGGIYADFTLGISVNDDERFDEEFIPIGKVCGAFSEEELVEINGQINHLTQERFGPTVLLKPQIMVEMEFEDIQTNKRTKAKFTLRKPKIKTILRNLHPTNAATLGNIERMYQEKLHQERENQNENPSFVWGMKR